jgi:hypothetical protein
MSGAALPEERMRLTTNEPNVKLTFTDLRRLTDLLYERTGLRFGPKRFGAIRTCVMKRMGVLGLPGVEEYITHAMNPENGTEWRTMADLMVADED